jgi:GAF domain-containing protein
VQRRGESGQLVKGGPKVRQEPTARVSTTDPQEQVTALTRELKEAREQQTATADVLKVISSSTSDLQAVFDTMVENAVRLCEAERGYIFRFDGKLLRAVASYNAGSEHWELVSRNPIAPGRHSISARAALERRTVHVADVQADPEFAYISRDVEPIRTTLAVPMLKGDDLVGTITIYRLEIKPFTDKQVALVETFAAQAVIAIENARLLNEQREALQQQTATADVLKVISRSTFDLQTVLDTLVESSARLCEAYDSVILLRQGESLRIGAHHGPIPIHFTEWPIGRGWATGRAFLDRVPVHVHDLQASAHEFPDGADFALRLGHRTILAVPLLREDEAIGALAIRRTEVKPFTDKQIELVQTFADQAVIAIENVRLFEAEQTRTRELSESLEQQTATAEVLKVISSSRGELEPVFEAMLANAARICEARFAILYLRDGDAFRAVAATRDAPPAYVEARKRDPHLRPPPDSPLGRVAATKQLVHIEDLATVRSYVERHPFVVAAVELGGFRSTLAVPLLKNDQLVGSINIFRQEVRPFGTRQIELVENFAAQAVIAIENTRLLNELRESLQQQTATANVLEVISRSAFDLQPVFETVAESAVRLCGSDRAFVFRFDGELLRCVVAYNAPPELETFIRKNPIRPGRGSGAGRAALERRTVHIRDVTIDPEYTFKSKDIAPLRTVLTVPILKGKDLLGVILNYRLEVNPFTDKQIALVEAFADQAAIAIENVRLFDEVQARTRELSESLEQQTATSEVLKVISSSPGELEPVFQAMLENATRICEAKFGFLWLSEDGGFRTVATHGVPSALAEERHYEGVIRFGPDVPLGRLALTKQLVHVADIRDEPGYAKGFRPFVRLADIGGARTLVVVPMLKDNELVGAITIYRQEVRPFGDKQIELLTNFAAQAVIAIENTRLLNELRETLERQTATSEVLEVISSSPGELQPIFDTILAKASELCEASYGLMWLTEGDAFRMAALHGDLPQAYIDLWRTGTLFRPGPQVLLSRVAIAGQPLQVPDLRTDASYLSGDPLPVTAADIAGVRTLLVVPMVRDEQVVGVIGIYRKEIKPFTDKQIELVTNFAAQAVIAIENARLLRELRESLQRQTATADVLKVISRSTFDLQTVLNTLAESAARLCEAENANIWQPKDDVYRLTASSNEFGAIKEFWDTTAIEPGRGTIVGRSLLESKTVHVHDVLADPEFTLGRAQELGGFRTVLAVPMLREGIAIGVFALTRREMRPFTDKQIELVTTFADQAAIAIENVRLFDNVEARTRELAKSLENLRTTQDRLVQTQKLASLGQLTAGIAHEIKNPLNFVNNFSGVSAELIDELQDALKGLTIDQKGRAEINELTDTLRGNLEKVVQHGKRADAIVKNMLLHSREGSGEHRVVDINTIVEESLNLAYHGARAEKQGFNITLERSLDPAAGEVDVFPQDITRVLLNLIANGFYAATKRKTQAGSDGYEPTLSASTRSLGDQVEIRIRDNGTGIPTEVKEKIFNPFFTTKPAGEGTGLGLSISHDIIVKQHGGSIEVDTKPGEFTEIRVILPRAAALLAERS